MVLCREQEAPRWLWEALDHQQGQAVAYVFGRRANRALLRLQTLLAPLGMRRFDTDGWGRIVGIWIPTNTW